MFLDLVLGLAIQAPHVTPVLTPMLWLSMSAYVGCRRIGLTVYGSVWLSTSMCCAKTGEEATDLLRPWQCVLPTHGGEQKNVSKKP